MTEELYYLFNRERGSYGGAMTWWKNGSLGYTHFLETAERMTKHRAQYIIENATPNKYEMYPCALIDKRTHIIFDDQDLEFIEKAPEDDWPIFDATGYLENRTVKISSIMESLKVIEFALTIDDKYNMWEFLNSWTHGDTSEWPEFKEFLK